MLKIIMLFMLLVNISYAVDAKQEKLALEWKTMTAEEKNSIIKSYVAGLPYNLQLTLAAINWQESMGGRWQISTDHNDVGIYHVNLYWYFKEMKIKDTIWNRSKYTTILMTKPKVCEIYVISKLQNLLLANGNDYYKAWWRYNGNEEYAKHILEKVHFLKLLLNSGKVKVKGML